jgi:prepilin-type N-terminal cleavage/methylation domain-containing protein
MSRVGFQQIWFFTGTDKFASSRCQFRPTGLGAVSPTNHEVRTMERQRVANSEWRLEQQRIAGRQRIAISEWRCDKTAATASRNGELWRLVERRSMFATRYSPLTTRCRFAFTLTELLVAIAILSIMFTLLFIPMTQAFDNARRGRIMANCKTPPILPLSGWFGS